MVFICQSLENRMLSVFRPYENSEQSDFEAHQHLEEGLPTSG